MKKLKFRCLVIALSLFVGGCSTSSTETILQPETETKDNSYVASTPNQDTEIPVDESEKSDVQDISVYINGKNDTRKYHYDIFCPKTYGSFSTQMLSEVNPSIPSCDFCCTEEEYNRIIEAINSEEQVFIGDNFRLSQSFHREGCRLISTRKTKTLTVQQALDLGLKLCDECNPDA